jgi:hypothetical protein
VGINYDGVGEQQPGSESANGNAVVGCLENLEFGFDVFGEFVAFVADDNIGISYFPDTVSSNQNIGTFGASFEHKVFHKNFI